MPCRASATREYYDGVTSHRSSSSPRITFNEAPSFLSESAGRVKCPVDPYFIIPDRCVCVDFQTLRLQESPDAVPHGEMPRHLQLYCDR